MDYFSFIYQRSNQQLVLTVTTPPLGNDPFSLDYTPAQGFEGAAVIVAHRKACANGNSSQLWRYDPITCFIEAFSADTTNRGMTFLLRSWLTNVLMYEVLCRLQTWNYAGEIWKRSFTSTVRPTIHSNLSRKRNFPKTLFKTEEFENAGFAF